MSTPALPERRYLSLRSAAEQVDLSTDYVRNAVQKRQLPAKRAGNAIRIREDHLIEWMDAQPDAYPESA